MRYNIILFFNINILEGRGKKKALRSVGWTTLIINDHLTLIKERFDKDIKLLILNI